MKVLYKTAKRKLNIKNMLLFAIMLLFSVLVLNDYITLITSRAMLTYFGIITEVLYIIIITTIYNYFKEFLNNKKRTLKAKHSK